MNKQDVKNKVVNFLKSRVFIAVVIGFILGALLFAGNDQELIDAYDYYKAQTEELEEIVLTLESDIGVLEGKNKELEEELNDPKIQEGLELLENKKDVLSSIESKTKEVDELDAKINQKTEILKKKEEEPIVINAGQYLFGSDIPEGRYIASAIGRGTNFIIYDSNGSLDVNTILSRGDYTFMAGNGYYLQTEGQVKLTPVE